MCPSRGDKDSECNNPTGEGKDSWFSHPTGGAKDSRVFKPHRREKDSLFPHPTGGGKTPCFHTPQERVKTPCVQSHIVFIQDQVQKRTNLTVGSRLKSFLPVWKTLGGHHSILNLIAEGYKLPFRECPKLSRIHCITSGFADFNKQSALSTAIQDLLQKGAIDIVQKPDSLGFYSRLFLVPKPGNCWRPDLSCLNKFLFEVQDGDPRVHTSFSQKERMGHLYRPHRRLPPHTHSPSVAEVPPVLPQRCLLPVHQPPFRSSLSPLDLHQYSQGSKTFSLTTGNTYSSIPRRLADSRPLQGGVSQTDPKAVKPNSGFGLCGEPQEIRTGAFPEVRFSGIPFFTRFGTCQAHSGQVDEASGYVTSPLVEVCYQCKDSYVHHWITCINGEDSQTGQNAYETFSMASQDSLEISHASGYSNPLESEDDTTWGRNGG